MSHPKQLQERSFSLESTLDIPRRLSEYTRGNRTLFVAIQKASFINVDSIGAEFVRLFEGGATLGSALATLRAKHGDAVDLVGILGNLLIQIETRGFYQHAQVAANFFDSLTLLARLTNRCNLRCTHCLVSSSPDWPADKELSTETWCSALTDYGNFANERGFTKARVTITGGEALYRPDAFEILGHSKSMGIRTELFSNGVMIANSKIASRVASVTDEVQISFDGATAPIHDAIRGSGMFERSLRAVRLLAEANARFRIAIVVMPFNYQDLFDNLATLVRSIPTKFPIYLGLAVNEGRADRSMQFGSTIAAEEKIRVLIDLLSDEGVRQANPIAPNLKSVSCGYAREMTIDQDGLVFACGPKVHPLGDLRKESFWNIADRIVTKSQQADVDYVEGCKECDIRYLCGGICRINNISQTGSAMVSSCDRANKERNVLKLFSRASDIVPLHLISNSISHAPVVTAMARPAGFVPLNSVFSQK